MEIEAAIIPDGAILAHTRARFGGAPLFPLTFWYSCEPMIATISASLIGIMSGAAMLCYDMIGLIRRI
jgi:hypothetical protein